MPTVGYTMSDIRYKWNDGLNSVQISSDVSLPQFKVLGHRQKTIEASLSTGKCWLPVMLECDFVCWLPPRRPLLADDVGELRWSHLSIIAARPMLYQKRSLMLLFIRWTGGGSSWQGRIRVHFGAHPIFLANAATRHHLQWLQFSLTSCSICTWNPYQFSFLLLFSYTKQTDKWTEREKHATKWCFVCNRMNYFSGLYKTFVLAFIHPS